MPKLPLDDLDPARGASVERRAHGWIAVVVLTASILVSRVALAEIDAITSLHSVAEAEALRARIDHDAVALARGLGPDARKAYLNSVRRLHAYAAAHCGYYVGQKKLEPGEGTCLLNIHGNFLAALPQSVYRVGKWHVYETGAYGIEWADGELLEEDPARPFWWDLQIIWPRVDAESSPVPAPTTLALSRLVHERIARWATGGWSVDVQVRFAAINDCYVSASIVESDYTGGAHPNDGAAAFNWSRAAHRELLPSDLFAPDRDWRLGLLALYRHHLAPGPVAQTAAKLDDDSLASSLQGGWVVTDEGLRFLSREGASRAETLPAVEVAWRELSGLLLPGAACQAK